MTNIVEEARRLLAENAPGTTDRIAALVPQLIAEVERLKRENGDLRGAVIHVVAMVNHVYREQRALRAIREAANRLSEPFSLDAVDAALAAEAKESTP